MTLPQQITMKTFEANRLSGGNQVFPAKITVTNHGVTLKVPGLFGGQEKTLGYRSISSINISSPLVGFSTITFDTLGFDRIVASGFSKDDANEIKELVQMGISGTIQGNTGGVNSDLATMMAANEAAKAQAEADKRKIELEERKYRDEKEAKEKSERLAKAAQYRNEGKNFMAFIYEYNVMMWAPITLLVVGGLIFVAVKNLSGTTTGETQTETIIEEPKKEKVKEQPKPVTQEEPTSQEYTDAEAIVYYKIQDPDGFTNMRDKPNGSIVRKVYPLDRFEVLGEKDGYKEVILLDGTTGFIHASRVVEAD